MRPGADDDLAGAQARETGVQAPAARRRGQHGRRRGMGPLFALAALGLCAALLVAAGVVAGVLAERDGLPERLASRADRLAFAARARFRSDAQEVEWRGIVTNLHSLEYARVRIGAPTHGGGAIAELAGHVLIASPLGRFSYLSADNRLAPLDLTAPMGLEALRESALMSDPLFDVHQFRMQDLYARHVEGARFDLYATFSRYAGENCFQLVVARAALEADEAGVRVADGTWRDVFVARPGCLRLKDRSWRYAGAEAGGRVVELDARTLLVGVGDHQFDGYNDSWAAAADDATDLGKLVALDIETGASRVYAKGFRNPAGLVRMKDGRIFEAEHGPQGGDEINFVREGDDYGWPIVTYGVNYGFPRADWPSNPRQGAHEGLAHPAFVFTPRVGPNNLVEADAREFPLWEGDLLLASLSVHTLFHIRAEGDRIIYVEPIEFGPHDRLRDMIVLGDGRVVMLSEEGSLIFVRNGEAHAREARAFTVSGLSTLTKPYPEESPRADLPPLERGRQVFAAACMSCHSLAGEVGAGPPLNGVVGRRVGAIAGYGYSPALANYEGVWSEGLLRSFLTDPERHFAGTSMPSAAVSWLDAPEVIAYLKTTRAEEAER